MANSALDSKFVEILTQIQASVQATGDFTREQLPDVVNQYLTYGRISNVFGLIIPATYILLTILYVFWVIKYHGDKEDVDEGIIGIGVFTSVTSVVFALPVLVWNINQTILLWAAPKVWILFEIKALLTK